DGGSCWMRMRAVLPHRPPGTQGRRAGAGIGLGRSEAAILSVVKKVSPVFGLFATGDGPLSRRKPLIDMILLPWPGWRPPPPPVTTFCPSRPPPPGQPSGRAPPLFLPGPPYNRDRNAHPRPTRYPHAPPASCARRDRADRRRRPANRGRAA